MTAIGDRVVSAKHWNLGTGVVTGIGNRWVRVAFGAASVQCAPKDLTPAGPPLELETEAPQ